MIQFTAEDIKSFNFVLEVDSEDDGEPLYEGTLTITFMDGTEDSVYLDWVREGHRIDFNEDNKQALIEYLNDYEIEIG